MSGFKRWHLALVPVPVLGWLLLVALLADELGCGQGTSLIDAPASPPCAAPQRARFLAGLVDAVIALVLALAPPPAVGYLLGAAYMLYRDGGRTPPSLGKWLFGLRAVRRDVGGGALTFAESFERNLILALPVLGPVFAFLEALRLRRGRERLGDRIAKTAVVRAPR